MGSKLTQAEGFVLGVGAKMFSCCGARCAPWRRRGCVAHRPRPLARVASSAPAAPPSLPRLLPVVRVYQHKEKQCSLSGTLFFWQRLPYLIQCNTVVSSVALVKQPNLLPLLKNLFQKRNFLQQISNCPAYNHCKETPKNTNQQRVLQRNPPHNPVIIQLQHRFQ